MKRILAASALLLLLASLTACVSGPQRVRTDEAWYSQLRGLAVEIIESETTFFADEQHCRDLLEVVQTRAPGTRYSIHNSEADAVCQYWRYDFTRPGTSGSSCVEICFELWEESPIGKLGIGLVDVTIIERLPGGRSKYRVRSIRPLQVLDYVSEIEPGRSAEYDSGAGTFTHEDRTTVLRKFPQ